MKTKSERNRTKGAACACSLVLGLAALAAPVEWEFPRLGNCHEGLPFADGQTGVLVWGGGDELRLTVGRSDLWDHRGGYPWTPEQSYTNIVSLWRRGEEAKLKSLFAKVTPPGEPRNPYMLPLGRVLIRVPGKTLKRGTLDPLTGLGTIFFTDGTAAELAMPKAERAFAIGFPKGVAPVVASVPATDREPFFSKTLAPLRFEKAAKRADGFDWKLPADKSVSLDFAVRDGLFVLTTARGGSDRRAQALAARTSFAALRLAARDQWEAFWREGARIRVPDAAVQTMYELGMYKFGAMTDPDGFPAGLQGCWLEDDRLVPWNGDFHFNINVQECYAPAFRGGHFAHLMPLFRMILSWRPRLAENARLFCGIPNGYEMPHSVDDRGVCIGGFWTGTIDHASAAWMASFMYRYVRYSGDVAFLREGAYDFMKGAMNVYLAMMEEKDGRLSIPLAPSPEWQGADFHRAVGRDPSFQLAACHRLARDLIAAAARLGEQPDPRWLDVERRLPAFTPVASAIGIFAGQGLTESHRHHSHMAGLYPFDTIPRRDGANGSLLSATYSAWVRNGTGQWSGWCVPWASILQTDAGNPVAAVTHLHAWNDFYCDEGHGSHHNSVFDGFTDFRGGRSVMQMDGQCAAAVAVLELLAHEINGRVEFFRGCPPSWKDVSFENLALSDGRRASGHRTDGRVEITYGK